MSMRLSGPMSGMDTESIIQQLVEAKKTKVDKTKKAQTKLNWKQDAWKALNTKLKNLQSKYLSSMRFTDAYSKKTTKVSNPNAVSVITGEDAVNGVQSLEIRKLAKTGYLTGGVIEAADGGKLTAMSKLSDLGITGSGSINVSANGQSVDIQVDGNTTISDVLTQLKKAGLNANFDEHNQRFFVSSKDSGAKSDFSITAMNQGGFDALKALGLQESFTTEEDEDKKGATQKEYEAYSKYYVAGDRAATLKNMEKLINKDVQSSTDSYLAKYKELVNTKADAQKKIDDINKRYADAGKTLKTSDEYKADLEAKNQEIAAKEEAIKSETDPDQKKVLEEELANLKKEANEITAEKNDVDMLAAHQSTIASADAAMNDVKQYVDIPETVVDGKTVYSATATPKLVQETENRFYDRAEFAHTVMNDPSLQTGGATKTNGQDAVIYLNGAEFTSKDNTFKINGLTFTALNETAAGEQITVTTQQDTDGIYDMVKNFLKEYNSIINEMSKLYNADSAKGYEPLTTEEKDALSESEVADYEKKIKDALLRRDENLSSISSTLKSVMSSGIEIGGKTMYLHDFGIETLGYFEAADNEKDAYHIAGDPDDASTSGDADVLKGMIANDPDTVISFFTKLSQNLYDEMSEMSKSVEGYRSFGSFYDDKKMKSDYDDYTSKIKEQEQKLNDYEDKWYKKFAAMETALAKMQSSANAVTSLLGG